MSVGLWYREKTQEKRYCPEMKSFLYLQLCPIRL